MSNCTDYIYLLLIISLTETCSYAHVHNTSCIICVFIQSYFVLDQCKQGMKRYTIDQAVFKMVMQEKNYSEVTELQRLEYG